MYSESVCLRLLGSSLATQRYKVSLYRMKTQEVVDLYGDSTVTILEIVAIFLMLFLHVAQ